MLIGIQPSDWLSGMPNLIILNYPSFFLVPGPNTTASRPSAPLPGTPRAEGLALGKSGLEHLVD